MKLTEKTLIHQTLREKCSYLEFFWSVFSCIRTTKTPNTDTLHAKRIIYGKSMATSTKKYFSILLQLISCSGYCEATHPCGECTCLDTCGSGYPYLCNCTSGKCHVKQTYISLEISYFGKLYNSSRWNTSSIFR